MSYLAILNWDGSNRITKFAEFATLAEAQAKAAQGGVLPGTNAAAFAVLHPGGGISDIQIDSIAKTAVSAPVLAPAKTRKIASLLTLAAAKLELGWTYGGNVYQVGEKYSPNMTKFLAAMERFTRIYPAWLTVTLYTVGSIVRSGDVFYKCLVEHTSGVLLTDLAAGKWAIWYFHPHLSGDGKWTSKANVRVSLTTAQAVDMCQAALDYEMRVLLQTRLHKDAIGALASAAAVDAYDITAGWPTNS